MAVSNPYPWQLASGTSLPASEASRRIYFFDEALPLTARNLHAVYPAVEKLGVVLAGDAPWEGGNVATFCSTILRLDDGRYRLYYTTVDVSGMHIAIAESTDGLTWHKRTLGQYNHHGLFSNRIVFTGVPERQDQVCQPQVVRLADGRWRMYYWHHQHGWGRIGYVYTAAESEDGLSWHAPAYDHPVLLAHWQGDQSAMNDTERLAEKGLRTNDANYVYLNPRLGVYEQFSPWLLDAASDRRVAEDNAPDVSRQIQRRTSADGLNWSAPELVIQADARDPWDQQFYHLAVQYHEDWMIGSLGHYRVEQGQQTQDLELVFSRDGHKWQRPLRGGFIPRSPGGRDAEGIYPPNAWIDAGSHWLCLYTAEGRKHNQHADDTLPPGCVMAARWPKHRFVGLAADRVPGGFMTDVFYPQDGEIKLDANIRGWLRAELCDAWGTKRTGFHLADCNPLNGDSQAHVLHWHGSSTAAFIDEPVRLRLEFSEAEVYNVAF